MNKVITTLSDQITPLRILLLCRTLWLIAIFSFVRFELVSVSFAVLIAASLIHLISIALIAKMKRPSPRVLALQIAVDLLTMTLLLAFNGGATNAFVTALLIPVVFSSIGLSWMYCTGFTLAAICAYSLLMLNMSSDMAHHMDMASHYHGMWINFILSTSVIALVVSSMAKMVTRREQFIAAQREQQLRQEQILAISIASAQVTHNIATPLATIQLLYEELQEDYPDNRLIKNGQASLKACTQHLDDFRKQISLIREGHVDWVATKELVAKLQDSALLYFPDQQLKINCDTCDGNIWSDEMLIPALVNLLQNAVNSNHQNGKNMLELNCFINNEQWVMELRDYGKGLNDDDFADLGYELIDSDKGLGIAALLSNMTIERLEGTLQVQNHPDTGCITRVALKFKNDR